jgi:hypothetical protein
MDLKPDARSPGMEQAPASHRIFLECLTVCEPGPSAKLGKSLFVDSQLHVDDAIVGIGGEPNRPGIAPLGIP